MRTRRNDEATLLDDPSCVGDVPLRPHLAGWMSRVAASPDRCDALLETYGSPVHLHEPGQLRPNVDALRLSASRHGIEIDIFFARKANRCVTYVETAAEHGCGVDVASADELEQVLEAGVDRHRIIVTAAVKPRALLEMCVREDILVVLDNEDEAVAVAQLAGRGHPPRVAIRIRDLSAGGSAARRVGASRFGIGCDGVVPLVDALFGRFDDPVLQLEGLHFHLDGYDASDRVVALDASLRLADDLAAIGSPVRFIDMGGGIPMSYLDDGRQWEDYWDELHAALLGRRAPVTYRNEGFGQFAHAGEIVGSRRAYPHHQSPVGGDWIGQILASPLPSDPTVTVADGLVARHLRLQCEPGRALLDGAGLTLARVEHRKEVDGDWLIGLAMNGSNCRSRKSELFTDPVLVKRTPARRPGTAMSGYLSGAYCAEDDLIMHRRLVFPHGVEQGDMVLFPNTAGYLMHFVESRSHQFPLPRNVVVDGDGNPLRTDAADHAADAPRWVDHR